MKKLTVNNFIRLGFLVVFSIQNVYSQSLYTVSGNLSKIPAYNSPKNNSDLLLFINKDSFFYCDTLVGDWYSCQILNIYEGTIEAYVHKSQVQLFKAQPVSKQKKIFTKAFTTFLPIWTSDNKQIRISSIWVKDSSYLVPVREQYYEQTFYPLLEEFFDYYKRNTDTSNLLHLFKFSPYTDGEFSETMTVLFFSCYMHNKSAFMNQLKKIKGKKYFSSVKAKLISGLNIYYPKQFNSEQISNAQIDRLLSKEVKKIKNL